MIVSFKHKGLERFFLTGKTTGVQAEHARKLQIILSMLDNATVIEDMNAPAFFLHRLKGDKKHLWSVKVNGNWRITFRFDNGDAEIVNYEDYH